MRIYDNPKRRFTRDEAEVLGAALREANAFRNRTEAVVASEFSTTQSRISRLFNGLFTRRTDLLERLCLAAGLDPDAHRGTRPAQEPRLPPALRTALAGVWDGTAEGAESVAELLNAASRCAAPSAVRKAES